ncbi:MAG TPA: nucleoside hydrolase [Propionibacteriaceae bacterium]|nr:nucleoside hydrolase [Propionibacteriaceae bacterium]
MDRLVLDVDLAMGTPGSDIDDGFALALALAWPDATVDLVTTVNGNTDVDTATTLTCALLQRLGRADLAVHRGAEVPLIRPRTRTGTVPESMAPGRPAAQPAAAAMVQHVLAHPGEITLVAVGPLTNVALALRLHPEFGPSLQSLVIMGGAFDASPNRGDIPGEFNVWSDPEAAHIVLASGVRARWVGLDVTLQVTLSRAEALTMQASDQPFASYAGLHTVAWIDHLNADRQHSDDACALHDPLAVAAVLQPQLLTWRTAHVVVDLDERNRGVLTTDYTVDDRMANAEVAVAVDVSAARELILTSISAL